MAIITKVKKLANELPHGTAPRGVKGTLVDKGERYGAAYAFGFSKTYFGSKFIWGGHGADVWLGVGGLAAAMLALAFGGRRGARLAPHLERLGDAGIISALGSIGAQNGMAKAGLQANLLPASPGAKRAIKGDDDILGMVPGGKGGAWLTDAQMLNFSSPR